MTQGLNGVDCIFGMYSTQAFQYGMLVLTSTVLCVYVHCECVCMSSALCVGESMGFGVRVCT